ncbi:hypothetical protein GOV04_05200 [Candidatus Woesearchaeota archaeon]|nr:hypothetical protein [Candidatus Woesearchaeota archaeon]
MFGKPWLKRDFRANTEFVLKTKYVIRHLNHHYKEQILGFNDERFEKWQGKKIASILEAIKNGKHWQEFTPIKLTLDPKRDVFLVHDGLSRLRAFKQKRVKYIRATLTVAES